ncbi:MAG TPA: MFS transporter [Propionibacteriaceae bacterium]|nr:MFS transporter [Propionibacteriaceae bacterium]
MTSAERTAMSPVLHAERPPATARSVATAAMIGTAIEWYDFFVYGTSVVLVLGPLFFPTTDPLTSALLAFSTLGVGFLIRPVGAVVFSHLGDRVGRKHALVFSLLLMGAATIGVGLLPTYTQVGLWAPALLVLFRCVQGFAVGGEWGGAVLLAVEHAPAGRRGLYGSFPQYGTPLGLLGSSAAILLAQAMPADDFQAWGWRLPFVASVVLVAVGLWIRIRVSDAEEFLQARQQGVTVRRPVALVLRRHWRAVLLGTAVTFVCHAAYILTSFLPAYATTVLGVDDDAALTSLMVASGASIGVLWLLARRVDRHDRRWFAAAGGLFSALWIYPAFALAGWAGGNGLILGVTVGLSVLMVQYAVVPALLAERFPVEMRYSGISLCFQLSAIIGGGALPILASWLVKSAGGSYAPAAALMAVAGLITAAAALGTRPMVQGSHRTGGHTELS